MERVAPGAVTMRVVELHDEEDERHQRGAPCDPNDGGEDTALPVAVAPAQMPPKVSGHSCSDDKENRQDEEADDRVCEAVTPQAFTSTSNGQEAVGA